MSSNPVRLATSPGKSNRPTVVITQDWHVWVGNENSEDLALEAMPLFGFGLGDYEDKVVEGTSIQIANLFLAVVKLSHSTLYWLQVPPITLLAVAALAPSFVITVSHIQPLRRWCAGCAETGCSLENDWWQSIGLLQWLSYTSVLCSAQNVIRPWFGWCPDLGPQAQPQDENCNLAQTCLLLCYILFWNLFDPNTYSITQ